jgi:outer membrane protein assembly factor BamB
VQRMLDIVANPVIVGDVAYLASSHGGIAAYDIRSSKVLWRSELVTIHNMAHDAHHLFVVTPSAEVYALDLRTGRVKWHQEEMHNRRLSAPVILKNTLVVADGFGSIFWLSAKSGKMLAYQVPGASAISASPVVKGNAVYFYSLWGTLIKYSLNSR